MKNFFPISQPTITQLEIDHVSAAVRSGWVSSLGEYIDQFEAEFAKFCGTRYAVSTSNGTTALHLALVASGVKAGDEIIVPDLTFVATANAVAYIGAKPVLADIDPRTLCIDPKSVESLITPKTKGIIPVHLYGHPANMDELLKIAKKHGLQIWEDAAEAHGAEINGKRVGSMGHCGIFSFYGNKIITTGEGGMITTDDEVLYQRCRLLRDHAMSKTKRYWHDEVGFNYRITNLQAALGVAQMKRIDEILEKRAALYERYSKNLSGIPNVRLNATTEGVRNVFWLICLEVSTFNEEKRSAFMAALKEQGVDSRPYFYPLSALPMYRREGVNPVTQQMYVKGMNLPSYHDLALTDVDQICDVIRKILLS